MARDTQQQRVYEWEWACVRPFDPTASNAASRLTLGECREIVEHAFSEFVPDAPLPNLNYSPENAKRRQGKECPARYWTDTHGITLPVWARSRSVVLHEIAHAMTRITYGLGVEGHGPEFTATALALWCCYLPNFDYEEARRRGVAHGIRFAATPPDRKVYHWADGPCCLCGIGPSRSTGWRDVRDIPFRDETVRDDVLSQPDHLRLRRIFELEYHQPKEVVNGTFDDFLRQIRDGTLLPDDHPLREHIKPRPWLYNRLLPGPRRTWVRDAIRLLDD